MLPLSKLWFLLIPTDVVALLLLLLVLLLLLLPLLFLNLAMVSLLPRLP